MKVNTETSIELEDKTPATDFDGFWKTFLENVTFLLDVIRRLIPELYAKIDMKKLHEIEYLDKEFQDPQAGEEPHTSARFVDCLIKLPLVDGRTEYVLLHIEIQGRGGDEIARRMLEYFCLIYKRHGELPAALLILTSPRPKEQTDQITLETFGTKISYSYNCTDIETLNAEELLESDKLADLMLYAVKRVMKINRKRCKKAVRDRIKTDLLKELYRVLHRKHRDEDYELAMRLMLVLFNLPEPLQEEVEVMLEEECFDMRYMNLWERRGYDRGYDTGITTGEHNRAVESALTMLADNLTLDKAAMYSGLPLAEVEELAHRYRAGELVPA